MKRKRFSVEQIVAVLKQAELGMPVADVIRQVGISEQTFYRWKKQYAGLQSDQVREFKQLQDENARLKKLVAELEPGQGDPAGRRRKKLARPALKRHAVAYMVSHYGLKMRRACRLVKQTRSVQYYRSMKDPAPGSTRSHARACARPRALRLSAHPRPAQTRWLASGKNQMYRLYSEEQLQLRLKLPKRRKMVVVRRERPQACAANDVWSLDFVADQLANGTRFRALTVVDVFTREALAIEVGQRLAGEHVVAVLNRLVAQRRAPKYLFVDNGSEFSGRLARFVGVSLQSADRLQPAGQAHGQLLRRDLQRVTARRMLELALVRNDGGRESDHRGWRRDYNETRPHMALNDAAPEEYARQLGVLNAEN